MVSTQIVANTFLYYGFEECIKISPMKLQKLIYFLFKQYAQKTNQQLFSEQFETWRYGPVLPSVYYEFSSFGSAPITKFARDAQGKVHILNVSSSKELNEAWSIVWNKYKYCSGSELSGITHQPGSAWSKAKDKQQPVLSYEDIINEQLA